ncbi:DUF896 domain-containing protein [Peribacillus cavernae]|uniref:UPF0291 protein ELQ35_09490 n=1 Tax=Peribacillus cavernae TaxID=1674310 RepID=A0A433HQE1_9BACI|nr:DUF896 domain-containing protein [Peribacillus cavernae]MDQ0216959.1 uncharacterized protein YnzC (UPF0291/DUF896 family) [Peribacillus cavernae]RUQ30551.1 DUF896 domain-containing protein [Peribacillus cavernae]
MLSKDKIARINELSKKSKEVGLTHQEAKEQTKLRSDYLQSFRNSMANTLENVTIIDPEGNDVTPGKIKEIKKNKKHLH